MFIKSKVDGVFIKSYNTYKTKTKIIRISLYIFGFVGWLVSSAWIGGNMLAENIKEDKSKQVRIETTTNIMGLNNTDTLGLIGLTGGFIFVFNSDDNKTTAISLGMSPSIEYINSDRE